MASTAFASPDRHRRAGRQGLAVDHRLAPDARVEPAVPADEATRRAASGHPHLNLNRRNRLFWPTTSTVTELVPERKLAFRVNTNNTVWSYELEPTATGTRVVESRHAENGVKPVVELLGQHAARWGAQFRTGTGRRHEHVAGADQGRRRKALVLLGFNKIEHAVVERVVARGAAARRRRGV